MREMLIDLYGHQAWADALHWRAVTAFAPAVEDVIIRERLHHIHLVQSGFLALLTGEPFALSTPADFPTPGALREYARDFHEAALAFVSQADDATLRRTVRVPWFENPVLDLPAEKALLQCAMHSQHHRGQNATRLRELGGEPPMTDLIVWYWMGRPPAMWE